MDTMEKNNAETLAEPRKLGAAQRPLLDSPTKKHSPHIQYFDRTRAYP